MKKKFAKRNAASSIKLYANPYAFDAKGWYFSSEDEYEKKFEKHLPVEEYEIDFIDGKDFDSELFKAMKVSQGNVVEYFERREELLDMDESEQAAVHYALEELGIKDVGEAIAMAEDDIRVTEGNASDYAAEYLDSMGGVGSLDAKTLEMYFDYEAFTRDMVLNGDITEFTFLGKTWTTSSR